MASKAWFKLAADKRGDLERLSYEATGLWHLVNHYCCAIGNDGRLAKSELHVAVSRKISEPKARRLAQEIVDAGLWLEHDSVYELVDWLKDQPSAAVWADDVLRTRWMVRKALGRDRSLCAAIQERDANLCRYCGVRVDWTNRNGHGGATYDHIDPDGPNSLDNVVVACRRCNGRKKDRTPEQAGMSLLSVAELRLRLVSPPGLDPVKPDPAFGPGSLVRARETGPSQTGAGSGSNRTATDAGRTPTGGAA